MWKNRGIELVRKPSLRGCHRVREIRNESCGFLMEKVPCREQLMQVL
jgi:hypothetical protein